MKSAISTQENIYIMSLFIVCQGRTQKVICSKYVFSTSFSIQANHVFKSIMILINWCRAVPMKASCCAVVSLKVDSFGRLMKARKQASMLTQKPKITMGSLPPFTVSFPNMPKAAPPRTSPMATNIPLMVARAFASFPNAYVNPVLKQFFFVIFKILGEIF